MQQEGFSARMQRSIDQANTADDHGAPARGSVVPAGQTFNTVKDVMLKNSQAGRTLAGTRLAASEPQIVLNGHSFKPALSRPPIILEETA